MDRKWKAGAAVGAPSLDNASDGYATGGNPGGGVPATKPGAHWYHMITEEPLAVIAAAGIAFDKTVVTQLRDALFKLFDTQGIDPGGRLTLESGVAVSTADQSGKTTVYFTPYKNNRIKLYDGTRWKWYTFTELSQLTTDTTKSPAAVAATKNYDMFVWDDAGTLRCTRGPKWDDGAAPGSNTARGTGAASTELEVFEGRRVNKIAIANGPAARCGLYVGSIGSDGSSQINDTLAKRHVWNMFNRRTRTMLVIEPANSWTYNGGYRQANANAANQIDMLLGLLEAPVHAEVIATGTHDGLGDLMAVGIGIDVTNANSAQLQNGRGTQTIVFPLSAIYDGYPGLGRHFLAYLEKGASAVSTWMGDENSTYIQSGIRGLVEA